MNDKLFTGTTTPPEITKQPGENYPFSVDYTGQLPTGATLSSAAVTVIQIDTGTNVTATLLASGTATISGNQAIVRLQSGTNGQAYRITFLATLSDTSILEDDVILRVQAR